MIVQNSREAMAPDERAGAGAEAGLGGANKKKSALHFWLDAIGGVFLIPMRMSIANPQNDVKVYDAEWTEIGRE